MKRTLAVLLALVCLGSPGPAFAAGTITETSVAALRGTNGYVLTLTATGDASDGTFPGTATSSAINELIAGLYLYMVETDPGSAAPTDNYDVEIRSARAVDLMGGSLANRDTSNTELAYPSTAAPIVDGALTIVISNNSVNSAVVVMRLYFTRSPVGAGSSSAGGAGSTVGGAVADNAAASGNPVPVGGTYHSGTQTYADGDRAELQTSAEGYVLVKPMGVDVAHDAVDAGNPAKIGAVAIAHGTNPTAVAAADRTNLYANRAGVLYTIGGHPNAVTATYIATGAATDDNVMPAIASGTKYVITRITVTLDEATTVGTAFRLGFGASVVPALGASLADAVVGIIVYHPGLVPGAGWSAGDGSGILAIGGDGEELRITCEAPTTGTLVVSVTYFTIES